LAKLEPTYYLTKDETAFMAVDTLTAIIVSIPILWQSNQLEILLKEQIIQTSKIQQEVDSKKQFLRKVCHVISLFHSPFTGTSHTIYWCCWLSRIIRRNTIRFKRSKSYRLLQKRPSILQQSHVHT
jgi:hypothetical protein